MISPRVLHRALRRELLQALPLSARRRLPGVTPDPFVAWDHTSRSIFIHVPKVAGTSLKTVLFGVGDASPDSVAEPVPQGEERWQRLQADGIWPSGHKPITAYYLADPERSARYFKFAFVRNPWDRLLSAWTYLTASPDRTPADRRFAARYLAGDDGFEAFVLSLRNPLTCLALRERMHFRSQRSYICLAGQRGHAMDVLGRFERLHDDADALLDRLGRPRAAELPHARPSHIGDYRDAYSARMREIVGSVYAQDIDLLDYRF